MGCHHAIIFIIIISIIIIITVSFYIYKLIYKAQ